MTAFRVGANSVVANLTELLGHAIIFFATTKDTYVTEAHSSSGLGHRPLKAEITGSNPVCATSEKSSNLFELFFLIIFLFSQADYSARTMRCASTE
jgi:hypothetical protein